MCFPVWQALHWMNSPKEMFLLQFENGKGNSVAQMFLIVTNVSSWLSVKIWNLLVFLSQGGLDEIHLLYMKASLFSMYTVYTLQPFFSHIDFKALGPGIGFSFSLILSIILYFSVSCYYNFLILYIYTQSNSSYQPSSCDFLRNTEKE